MNDQAYEPLQAMQFEVLQAFEEMTNGPENVSPTRHWSFLYGVHVRPEPVLTLRGASGMI